MRLLAAAAVLAVAASGCSATVALAPQSLVAPAANRSTRIDGQDLPAIEGRILGSDGHHLVVERCHDGRAVTVPREDVRDIDHPGNWLAGVGVVLAAAGLVLLPFGLSYNKPRSCAYSDSSSCSTSEPYGIALTAPGVALLSVGVPTAITGLVIWKTSKAAAKD